MCDTTLTRPLFSFRSLELSDWRWLRVWTMSHVRLQWMTICFMFHVVTVPCQSAAQRSLSPGKTRIRRMHKCQITQDSRLQNNAIKYLSSWITASHVINLCIVLESLVRVLEETDIIIYQTFRSVLSLDILSLMSEEFLT